jgi:hypothetical protein
MSEVRNTIQSLFKKKSAWIKGSYATNGEKGGGLLEFDAIDIPNNDDAVCFCLSGAVTKVYENLEQQGLAEARLAGVIRALYPDRARVRSNKQMGNESVIVNFNDHKDTTIEEIRHVVKVANV